MHPNGIDTYDSTMAHRTTIELDLELVAQARQLLGTRGIKDTVEQALREVVRADLRRQLADQFVSGDGFDSGDEILRQTRPTR